jgi:hypothetical protein
MENHEKNRDLTMKKILFGFDSHEWTPSFFGTARAANPTLRSKTADLNRINDACC